MKQNLFNKLWLRVGMIVAIMTTALAGTAWAADESVDFSTQGYSNQQAIESYTGTNFSITFYKGTNSNAPKYYTSGTAIRAYGGNTITVSSTSKTIAKIEITFGSSDGSNAITTNVGTYSNGTWTGSASSVTFTIGGTSGNRRIAGIAVTYAGSTPTPTTYTVTYNANGGTGTMTDDDSPYDAGATVTVLGNEFTRDGYTFTNWNTKTDGTGTDYDEDDTFTINANTTLYAQWEEQLPANTTKLTFDVTDNPGGWPTANETTLKNYTYTLNSVDYTFALKNVKCNSGYLMMTATAVLGLPAIEGYKLTKVVASNSSGCSTSTKVGISSSDASPSYIDGGAAQTWSTTSSQYTYNLTSTEPNTMYYLYVTNKNAQVLSIALTYEADSSTPAPVISGTTPFMGSTSVTITAEDGASIYYTVDGADPTTSSTPYTEPFTINATTTVKAIAVKNSISSSIASETFTLVTPITVAEARAAIDAGEGTTGVYVQGIVSGIVTAYSSQYHNISYNISADGTTTSDQLQAYRGKGINGANFTSADDILVGDVVVVYGNLTKYGETYEFAEGNYLISKTRKPSPELAYATTEYTVAPNASFTTPELTNPHNVTVTYSVSENNGVASVNSTTGAVTIGANEGTVTVTASFAGNETYSPGSASYTIIVSDETKGTIDNPYTVADLLEGKVTSEKYVRGYIVGCFNNGSRNNFTRTGAYAANLALADDPEETSQANAAAIQMVNNTEIRDAFNVVDKPYNIGVAQVVVKGSVETYLSANGIKAPTAMTKVAEYVKVTNAGYATYYTDCALDFTGTGITSYVGSIDEDKKLTFVPTPQIPAEEGILLVAAGGASVNVPVIESATAITDNCMEGTLAGTTLTANDYILNVVSGKAGFYKAGEFTALGAHRAYIPASAGGQVKSFFIDLDDDATGISTVETFTEEGAIFNLAGQRLQKMQKGINIVNGKKILK